MTTTRRPFRRRPASRGLPKPVLWAMGLLSIAAFVAMVVIGFKAPNGIPGRSYYTLEAQLANADNLPAHAEVRIAGRNVGQVIHPRVEDGKAVVDLQLTPDVAPLRSDTELRVRPRSVVGARFLQLSPGTKGTPLDEGARIPAEQTSAATSVDIVVDTLDAPRRARLQTFMRELGAGALGRGDDGAALISSSPGALRGLERLAGAVNERGGAPARLIAGSQGAAAAADPVRDTIRLGFRSGAAAFRPFADGSEQIRSALREAPSSLRAARAGFAAADPLFAELGGLSRAALPALRPAPRGLTELATMLRESHPALGSLHTTLDVAEDATPPALKLLDTVDPLLPSLSRGLVAGLPLLDRIAAHGCDVDLFMRNVGSAFAYGVEGGRKDIGPIGNLRLEMLLNEESIGGHTQRSRFVRDDPNPAPCTVRGGQR